MARRDPGSSAVRMHWHSTTSPLQDGTRHTALHYFPSAGRDSAHKPCDFPGFVQVRLSNHIDLKRTLGRQSSTASTTISRSRCGGNYVLTPGQCHRLTAPLAGCSLKAGCRTVSGLNSREAASAICALQYGTSKVGIIVGF